ncbi:MAG TPA: precorrin-3B C(17)-methyltransferase [Acidimicrobiales bacterium]|nr:precorrin-3B C(17)-methyltransferase [Acidimicrobiales bacterium]
MRVLAVSVTDAGHGLAARLPFERVHGDAAGTVRSRWAEVDAFVLFLATGAATRIAAPMLADKQTDPAVVCVDEAGRFAVALTGGHEGGGNLLAHRVAHALGAEPVITTASDTVGTGLVAGVGCSTNASLDDVFDLLVDTLGGRVPDAVATVDRRRDQLTALGLPVVAFTPDELDAVAVPNPSPAVQHAIGTASVAEAAALLAAGPGGELVTPKRKSSVATVAVARRNRGALSVVGLGPGHGCHRTPAASDAVRSADVVIGYEPYVDQAADLLRPGQEVIRSPIGAEVVRAKQAVAEAEAGRRVALVCSGDPGVYAMASLALELAPDVEVEVVPGVTAALAAAAVLGAPLGHDHTSISLSDHLTPWPVIERRLRAAAEADLVVALYNPRSARRPWQLDAARALLLQHRAPETPVGVVADAARASQDVRVTALGDLDAAVVGMTSIVLVGNRATRLVDGRMVTPRGYLG